jgi:hypothetical protein
MATYVTIQQAIAHVQLPIVIDTDPPDPRQADLQLKLDQAEAIILDYIKGGPPVVNPLIYPGDPPSIDPVIQAAILLEFAELWRFRGDDQFKEGPEHDLDISQLSPTITNLLRRKRDPALA